MSPMLIVLQRVTKCGTEIAGPRSFVVSTHRTIVLSDGAIEIPNQWGESFKELKPNLDESFACFAEFNVPHTEFVSLARGWGFSLK